jgi:protein-S-isoprenylcysteine O-methyltransferase Ste14
MDASRSTGFPPPGAPFLSRIRIGVAAAIGLQGVLLFGSAGTWTWREAWLYLMLATVYAILALALLRKNHPQLLNDIMLRKPGMGYWSRPLVALSLTTCTALLIVPGLDVRWGWSTMSFTLKGIGYGFLVVSLMISIRVLKEGAFLSRLARSDGHRSESMIGAGPHRQVRHPMYAAVMLGLVSFPIAVGSWIGLFPATVLAFLIIIRIPIEEEKLQKEVVGYTDYVREVPYRLIPGVW